MSGSQLSILRGGDFSDDVFGDFHPAIIGDFTTGVDTSASQITLWTSEALPDGYINVIKRDPQMAGIQVDILNATAEEVQRLMLQGRGPDILLVQSSEIQRMAGEKKLLSIEDISRKNLTLSNNMKLIIPVTRDLVNLNGNLFGVPQAMLIQGICYNPTPINRDFAGVSRESCEREVSESIHSTDRGFYI